MNIDLKKRLYQTSSLLYGYCVNPTFSNAEGSPAASESIAGTNLPDVSRFNVPSMRPYGFTSVANPNTLQVVMPAGVSSINPLVLGHLDVFDGKPFSLASGESAQYSNGVALKAGNTSFQYYYNEDMEATPISGEDVNKIFIDIISYLQTQLTSFMNSIVTIYNEHTHPIPGGDTGLPSPQIPTNPPFPPELVTDLQSVQDGKTLINSSGITPLP